jgi:pectin methylesterase-like acyl-CoA thioesterase
LESNNSGPGAFQTGRVSFAQNVTADVVAPYTLSAWLGDTSWIDMTAYNYVPTYPLTKAGSTPVSSAPGAVSTINAHPDSGVVAPNGSVIVDITGATGKFTNVTAALASLPADSTNKTIFIMPGTYVEQIPQISNPGPIRIIGYTTAAPGASYTDNTVKITFARGLSVSPLPVGHSDAETATIQTQSSTIAWYNIIIENSDNLDGLEASYVTLAASTYGSQIGFYACSFIGWQDTLLTGSTNGYQYFENS